jgi:DNA-binding response OmpR family regulator
MKQIAVVDDDPDILDAIQFVLEDAGYDVVTSPKGEYAENLPNQSKLPDLLILDMLLSGKDGRVICQKLKNQRETQHMPILMISAHPSAKEAVAQVGADDFLPKPFDINTLLEKVDKSIQLRKYS